MFKSKLIIFDKSIYFNYFIKDKYEAGIILEGWEVKSVRCGNVQISNSYVDVRNSEPWLVNCLISPTTSISSHESIEITRKKKLLLHKKEIMYLLGMRKLAKYSIILSKLYWKNNIIKAELCLCIGKSTYDKRHSLKNKDWSLSKEQILKSNSKYIFT